MRELILSDITEMGQGLCVIGIERAGENSFRSVRPIPPAGYSWPLPFPHKRGSFVRFETVPTAAFRPHLEDQYTHGLTSGEECLDEEEVVDLLRHAETSESLDGLFGCGLHRDQLGGNAWVPPDAATRSICGCSYANMRFRVFVEPGRVKLTAMLALASGEVLHSLPIVDWAWRQFLAALGDRILKPSARRELDDLFNRSIRGELVDSDCRFARIGLPRPNQSGGKCWLMLDSLFPQPKTEWLRGLWPGSSVDSRQEGSP